MNLPSFPIKILDTGSEVYIGHPNKQADKQILIFNKQKKQLASLWFKGLTLSSKNREEFCQLLLKNQSQQQVLYSVKCTCKGLQKSISELER